MEKHHQRKDSGPKLCLWASKKNKVIHKVLGPLGLLFWLCRWQGKKGGGQWSRAKSFDTFCPLGPSLVPLQGVEESRDTNILGSAGVLEQYKLALFFSEFGHDFLRQQLATCTFF